MGKFRLDSLAELARQMGFTPHLLRERQLSAAEELLHAIDPAKAYPLDFVVFRVTGYHPKTVSEDLLAGGALQHDLGLLIEKVSDSLDLRVVGYPQPVLGIDDVTEKFNVTSKTIQRWRRRGLPSRRFIFADGKRRVGFLLSSVEKFLSTHHDQVERGANFSQVGQAEHDEILRRARRLAGACRCCTSEIARRIGGRMHRSPLTVLHTIRKHDQEHPDHAIFAHAGDEIGSDERGRILRANRRGISLRTIARRLGRTRAAVYRVILDERIERLNRRKTKFIDDPLYHQPDADVAVDAIVAAGELPADESVEDRRVPRDLPTYLQDLYRTPLLSPARERALFLKFNFHKFRFFSARRKLEPQFARRRDLDLLEAELANATHTKNAIIRANLRLVVSIARKHLRPGLSLMELISDGNITLMRAVESFDAHRGNRFSTYATLALMKGFARSVPMMLAGRAAGSDVNHDLIAAVPDSSIAPETQRRINREEVAALLSRLDARERDVLLAHYGLDGRETATYEQVGRRLGLSKQRVRQIEQTAIEKLRASSNPL